MPKYRKVKLDGGFKRISIVKDRPLTDKEREPLAKEEQDRAKRQVTKLRRIPHL